MDAVLMFTTEELVETHSKYALEKKRDGRNWVDEIVIMIDSVVVHGLRYKIAERVPGDAFREMHGVVKKAGGGYEWPKTFVIPWKSLLNRLEAIKELGRWVNSEGYEDTLNKLSRAFDIVVGKLKKHAAKVLGISENEIVDIDFRLSFNWMTVKTVRFDREKFDKLRKKAKYIYGKGFAVPVPKDVVKEIAEEVYAVLKG